MESTSKKAKDFLKKYELKTLSVDILKNVIQRQGYKIILFNPLSDTDKGTILIDKLNPNRYQLSDQSLSFANDYVKYVFLAKNLSENEIEILLLHEEGHIFCGHLRNKNKSKTEAEDEANRFGFYVRLYLRYYHILHKIKINFKRVSVTAVVIALLLSCGVLVNDKFAEPSIPNAPVSTPEMPTAQPAPLPTANEVVITKSGKKYHRPQCKHVRYKQNTTTIATEEAVRLGYEPCADCMK